VAASIAPPIAVGLFLTSTSLIFTVAALAYAATFAAYFISIKNFPRKNVLLSYWRSVGQSYVVIARDKVILGIIFSGIIIFLRFCANRQYVAAGNGDAHGSLFARLFPSFDN
jgi:Na+/H+-translocating membrane pyrophosphatase